MKAMQTNACQSETNFDNTMITINSGQPSEINTHYSCSQCAKVNLAIATTLIGAMLIKPAISSPSSLLGNEAASTETKDSVIDDAHQLINPQETITFTDKPLPIHTRYVKRAFGNEFQINTYTTDYQAGPSIAALTTGDFVVVWGSGCSPYPCDGQDGNGYGIYGQRYSSTGIPQSSEFQINTYTINWQGDPSVAGLSTGEFVVAWQSHYQDGDGYGIYAQRFSNTEIQQGTEFQVNTYTTNTQQNPSVAGLSTGDFVVVWSGEGVGSLCSVYGQRYSSTGNPQGSEFQINTYTSCQRNPSVAALTTGDFVVVWECYRTYYDICGRHYSSMSLPKGAQFRINTSTNLDETNPSVAALSTGGFVVVWGSGVGSVSYIYGQRFSSTGLPLGSEFPVVTHTVNAQRIPSVAALTTGDFVVVWMSEGQDGEDGGIYGQRYSSTGIPQDSEFQVNTYTTGRQSAPSVTALNMRNFVVVWHSDGQDGDEYGIYGRILDDKPMLITNSLTINEGATVIFTTLNLSANDLGNDGAELIFIVSNLQHGQFEYVSNAGITITNFTQQNIIDGTVQFVHDGSKNQPRYDVSVNDGTFSDGPISANITFIYMAQNQLVIQPSEALILGPKQLDIQAQLAPTNLEIRVADVQFGHFEKIDGSWKVTTVFNLSELNTGKIRFVHDGTENKPHYILQFKDLSTNFTLPRQIIGETILNHPPELINPIGVLSTKINEDFSYVLPNNIFRDPDNQLLQVSVKPLNSTALPAWVQFDNLTTTLNGNPIKAGSFGFKAIAADPYGATAEDRFYIDAKRTNTTAVIGEGTNPVPFVAAIAGGALLLGSCVAAGFWYRKKGKDSQTRKQHPFADYVRSELKLQGLDNFATSKGSQYLSAINLLTAVLKDNYGIDINRIGENELKRLAKQVALAAKSQITPKKSGLFQKSAITVEDLSDANNAQAIARTVQRLADGFDEIPIIENNNPADNNFGTLVEEGVDAVRQFFSPKMELV